MGALDGKVAIVTAAAGVGIGQAVARCFAAEGAAVVVTDAHARRVHEVGEAMSKDYGRDFLAMEVNVADSEQVNAMARAVLDHEIGSNLVGCPFGNVRTTTCGLKPAAS